MKTFIKIIGVLNLSLLLSCSQNTVCTPPVPTAAPKHAVRTSTPAVRKEAPKPEKKTNVIGAIEPIYILPMKSAFEARIDTGASISSLDAQDIKEFERDGEKWVSFKIVNRRSQETHSFEKRVVKNVRIKRIHQGEDRVKVNMAVRFGGEEFTSEFTLADRSSFEFQGLIGRNILSGRAVVDTSVTHTLK